MNHEVFQYQNEWYYFKEGAGSECTSGCDFPSSPVCSPAKTVAGLPLCKGRTIKKLGHDIFDSNDTITIIGTGRKYRVVQSSIVGKHCDSCEFRTACSYGAEKYCPVFCTLQRIDTTQPQPQPTKHSVTPAMPKVIRVSMQNYIDENNNIYDLRAMPRLFNIGDKVTIDSRVGACENYVCRKISSFSTSRRGCNLLNCKLESFCRGNKYLCTNNTALVPESIDFSVKYAKRDGGVKCIDCAARILGSGCCAHVIEAMNGIENHVACNNDFHYVKEPQQPITAAIERLIEWKIDDGIYEYLCTLAIDKLQPGCLKRHPTSTKCADCILGKVPNHLCVLKAACNTAWILDARYISSLEKSGILHIVGIVKKANRIIRSEPPLTPKESFPEEKHITIKRSSFKPKITKLKEVKWKTQTKKNR